MPVKGRWAGSKEQLDFLNSEIAEVSTLAAARSRNRRVGDVDRRLTGLNSTDRVVAADARSFLADGLNEHTGYTAEDQQYLRPDHFANARFSEEHGAVYFRNSRIVGDTSLLDDSDIAALGRLTWLKPSAGYLFVAERLNALNAPGFTIMPDRGRLANTGVVIVDDLLNINAVLHERRHRGDMFITARTGADRALTEVLSHLGGFEPEGAERDDWQRLADRIGNNGFVRHCIWELDEPSRTREIGNLGQVMGGCYQLYSHLREREGLSPERSHVRLLRLVETSLTMTQFNGAAENVLDGKQSNLAVNDNLARSKEVIRAMARDK